MSSQQGHHREDDDHDSSYMTDEEEVPDSPSIILANLMEKPTGVHYNYPGVTSGSDLSKTINSGPWPSVSGNPSIWSPPWFSDHASTLSTTTVKSTPTPEWDSQTFSPTPTLIATNHVSLSSTTPASNDFGGERPGWNGEHKPSNRAVVYAAAVVISIVVLAAIGFILFCLRKRKRQSQEIVATHTKVEEMRTQSRYTTQPSTGPLSVLPQYTASLVDLPSTNPTCPQPVLLSGSNGAYLTGIDTSDMVSVTSDSNMRSDPFADNNSLAEAPPPYRPRSLALSSRQSSFRWTAPPPASSQTLLIQHSPFEDPGDDDDVVSELDGPVQGRCVDAMSVVSDLSYQKDPIVGRSSIQ